MAGGASISSSPSLPDSATSPDRPLATPHDDANYDRKLLEQLVHEISSVRKMATASPSGGESKKRKREVEQTVRWLRGVALNPTDPELVVRESEKQILSVRREMFLKIDAVENLEDLPDFASLRKKKKEWHFSSPRYKNKRRSERISRSSLTSLSLSSHLSLLRQRIGIGRPFQANIPSRSSSLSSYNTDPDVMKYLGTVTWPVIGKTPIKNSKKWNSQDLGCKCVDNGSVECVRKHIEKSTTKLRCELGPAFYAWGFDSMGDYLSNSFLTRQEQLGFEKIEENDTKKGFWKKVEMEGTETKKRRDLVWYYFNVFLLRRVSRMSRNRPGLEIDSCDEDDDVMEGNLVISQNGCLEKPKRRR